MYQNSMGITAVFSQKDTWNSEGSLQPCSTLKHSQLIFNESTVCRKLKPECLLSSKIIRAWKHSWYKTYIGLGFSSKLAIPMLKNKSICKYSNNKYSNNILHHFSITSKAQHPFPQVYYCILNIMFFLYAYRNANYESFGSFSYKFNRMGASILLLIMIWKLSLQLAGVLVYH